MQSYVDWQACFEVSINTVRLCQVCRWQHVQNLRVQNVTSPITKLPSRKLTYPTLGKWYVSSLEGNSKKMEFVVRSLRILCWSVAFLYHPAVGDGFKPLDKKECNAILKYSSSSSRENHRHLRRFEKTPTLVAEQQNAALFGTCNSWQVCWFWQLQIYLLHSHWAITGWRKAYESINWPVLNQLLPHLDGHFNFIKWIIQKQR